MFILNLTILLALPELPKVEEVTVVRRRRVAQDMMFDLWREADLKPVFTFLLRPRLIQAGLGVKLLCCLSGKPLPKVTWYKGGNLIEQSNSSHYQQSISKWCMHIRNIIL